MDETAPAKRMRYEPGRPRASRGKRTDHTKNDEEDTNTETTTATNSLTAPPACTERRVCINVGGTHITTLASTLRAEASLLSEWVDNNFAGLPRDAKGFPFIDRDPDNFRQVINYLRGYNLPLETEKIVFLAEDAEYYRIDNLRALINPPAQWRFESGPGVSPDGMLFSTDNILGVCGREPLPTRGKSFIALRVDKCELVAVGLLGTDAPLENVPLQHQPRAIAYCNTGELVRAMDEERTYTPGAGFKNHDLITIQVEFVAGPTARIVFFRGDLRAYETEWPNPIAPLRFAVSLHGASSVTIERSGVVDAGGEGDTMYDPQLPTNTSQLSQTQ